MSRISRNRQNTWIWFDCLIENGSSALCWLARVKCDDGALLSHRKYDSLGQSVDMNRFDVASHRLFGTFKDFRSKEFDIFLLSQSVQWNQIEVVQMMAAPFHSRRRKNGTNKMPNEIYKKDFRRNGNIPSSRFTTELSWSIDQDSFHHIQPKSQHSGMNENA